MVILRTGTIEGYIMPQQNLDSAFMLAIGIWLLALFIFGTMLIIVFAKLIRENRAGDELELTGQQLPQSNENPKSEASQ